MSGRGTVAMWGYPLWLFLGLWLVLTAQRACSTACGSRASLTTWAIVFTCLGAAFYINYDVLPRFDHRYRAVFFPGGSLGRDIGAALSRGRPAGRSSMSSAPCGTAAMSRITRRASRAMLVDGEPQRAPWIDLADLKRQGAAVVWTDSDPRKLPAKFAEVAAGAVVQPSFTLAYRRGPGHVTVGWAILKPRP